MREGTLSFLHVVHRQHSSRLSGHYHRCDVWHIHDLPTFSESCLVPFCPCNDSSCTSTRICRARCWRSDIWRNGKDTGSPLLQAVPRHAEAVRHHPQQWLVDYYRGSWFEWSCRLLVIGWQRQTNLYWLQWHGWRYDALFDYGWARCVHHLR